MSFSAVGDEVRALFASAGLGTPPIPGSLEPQLCRIREWHFATKDAPTISPYNYVTYAEEVGGDDTPDSLVLAHAGHGVNSYAISYFLVLGSIRILLQLEWGGVYMNAQQTSSRIRSVFDMLRDHLPAIEQRAARPPCQCLSYSDFYSREDLRNNDDLEDAVKNLCAR